MPLVGNRFSRRWAISFYMSCVKWIANNNSYPGPARATFESYHHGFGSDGKNMCGKPVWEPSPHEAAYQRDMV